jgi:hypothetical protein
VTLETHQTDWGKTAACVRVGEGPSSEGRLPGVHWHYRGCRGLPEVLNGAFKRVHVYRLRVEIPLEPSDALRGCGKHLGLAWLSGLFGGG